MQPAVSGTAEASRLRSNSDLPERHVLAVFANVKARRPPHREPRPLRRLTHAQEVAGWSIFKSKCIGSYPRAPNAFLSRAHAMHRGFSLSGVAH